MPEYRVRQYTPSEDHSALYFYECAEAKYATLSVRGGLVPRTTDLLYIDEARTFVRFSTLADAGVRKRQFELTETAIRHLTPADLKPGAKSAPFKPLTQVTPQAPLSIKHLYDIGGEGAVARKISAILGAVVGAETARHLTKLIDIFSWAAIIQHIPADMQAGQSLLREPFDVELLGADYHNHGMLVMFDRVDLINGARHAYFKIQSQGNFSTSSHHDSNYHAQFHIALEGPSCGLVTRGEMQEIIFEGGHDRAPLTILQRQVAMHMQSDAMRVLAAGEGGAP